MALCKIIAVIRKKNVEDQANLPNNSKDEALEWLQKHYEDVDNSDIKSIWGCEARP